MSTMPMGVERISLEESNSRPLEDAQALRKIESLKVPSVPCVLIVEARKQPLVTEIVLYEDTITEMMNPR